MKAAEAEDATVDLAVTVANAESAVTADLAATAVTVEDADAIAARAAIVISNRR